eukprot:14662006-Alexandrium_andersonii.AAC.1
MPPEERPAAVRLEGAPALGPVLAGGAAVGVPVCVARRPAAIGVWVSGHPPEHVRRLRLEGRPLDQALA